MAVTEKEAEQIECPSAGGKTVLGSTLFPLVLGSL